ncbi:hypothetical protein TrCOL_g9602 [Triparma columacea]|uniref:Uncharacterized protein n=1 Tax=Triparma columacea TaxID=722753 RepID=A0A9W7L325_9STRA|nr:hypothetical protein TrCOL_g9602 [Triparma columacea]
MPTGQDWDRGEKRYGARCVCAKLKLWRRAEYFLREQLAPTHAPQIVPILVAQVAAVMKSTGVWALGYAKRNVKVEDVIEEARRWGMTCERPEVEGDGDGEGVFIFRYGEKGRTVFEERREFVVKSEPETFDDGHTPALAKIRELPNMLRHVDKYRPEELREEPFMASFDDAVEAMVADLVYLESTIWTEGTNSWGAYITMEECKEALTTAEREGTTVGTRAEKWGEYWKAEYHRHEKNPDFKGDDREDYRKFLSLEVAMGFLFTAPSIQGTVPPHPRPSNFFNPTLHPSSVLGCNPSLTNIHGFALWSLSSVRSLPHGVSYHIDYAELVRYKTGVIHPPVYAGTVQVTRGGGEECKWGGGGYYANRDGLKHYESHGYKACKLSSGRGAKGIMVTPSVGTPGSNWAEVPYKYRRGTWHTGELPHQSGEVLYRDEGEGKEGEDGGNRGWGKTRVIVGINAFDWGIGEEVGKATEHSKAFNREVRLAQALTAQEAKASLGGSKGGMDLKAVMEGSGAVRKMLVLAKREKVKRMLEEERRKMDEVIEGWGGGMVEVLVGRIVEIVGVGRDTAHVHVNMKIHKGDIDVMDGKEGMGGDGMVKLDAVVGGGKGGK